jgi:hypothetical protein
VKITVVSIQADFHERAELSRSRFIHCMLFQALQYQASSS